MTKSSFGTVNEQAISQTNFKFGMQNPENLAKVPFTVKTQVKNLRRMKSPKVEYY